MAAGKFLPAARALGDPRLPETRDDIRAIVTKFGGRHDTSNSDYDKARRVERLQESMARNRCIGATFIVRVITVAGDSGFVS